MKKMESAARKKLAKKLTIVNILLFGLFILSFTPALACDMCNIYEYNTLQNKNYIGVFYRYRTFNGYRHLNNKHKFFTNPSQVGANRRILHDPETAGLYVNKSGKDYERYYTYEVRANYSIKNKVNLLFLLPYRRIDVYYDKVIDFPNPQKDSLMTLQGWGDAILAFDYIQIFAYENNTHILKPGFAIKLPTGEYKQMANGQQYDPVIQPGTGAFDFLIRLNYQYIHKKLGFNTATNYKFSTNGKNNYKFGGSFNLNQDIFYQLKCGMLKIIPKTGAYLEISEKDRANGITQPPTGGTTLFANGGVDFYYKIITLQILYQKTVYEKLNEEQIGNAGRLTAGLVYSF